MKSKQFNDKRDKEFGMIAFDNFILRCNQCKKTLGVYGGNPISQYHDSTYCIKCGKVRGFIGRGTKGGVGET